MPAYIFDPVNTFREAVPDGFLENSVRLLFDIYLEAYQDCLRFPKWERHDIRSHYRRALFEWQWRGLGETFLELLATPIPNSKRTAYHTEIRCGSIVLIEAHVESPTTIVRSADFRDSLTMRYQPLFAELDEEPTDTSLVAILLHGSADERTPGFAHIVFPLRDAKAYHDDRINLFDWFSGIVASKTSFQEELVGDEIEPELREDVPNVGGA